MKDEVFFERALAEYRESTADLQDFAELPIEVQTTFGLCLNCEQEINLSRLKAIPWVRYCINCQELIEEQRRRLRLRAHGVAWTFT